MQGQQRESRFYHWWCYSENFSKQNGMELVAKTTVKGSKYGQRNIKIP